MCTKWCPLVLRCVFCVCMEAFYYCHTDCNVNFCDRAQCNPVICTHDDNKDPLYLKWSLPDSSDSRLLWKDPLGSLKRSQTTLQPRWSHLPDFVVGCSQRVSVLRSFLLSSFKGESVYLKSSTSLRASVWFWITILRWKAPFLSFGLGFVWKKYNIHSLVRLSKKPFVVDRNPTVSQMYLVNQDFFPSGLLLAKRPSGGITTLYTQHWDCSPLPWCTLHSALYL